MSRHKFFHHVAIQLTLCLLLNKYFIYNTEAFTRVKTETETPNPVNLAYLSHFLQTLPFSHQRSQPLRTFQQYAFHQYSPVSTPIHYQYSAAPYQSPKSMSHNEILWKMWLRNSHRNRNSRNQYSLRYPLKHTEKYDHPRPSELEETVQFPIRFRSPKVPAFAKQNYNDLVQAESQTTTKTTSDKEQKNESDQNEISKSKSKETETFPVSREDDAYSKSYLKQLKKSSEKKHSILEKLALKKRLYKKKWASKKNRKAKAQEKSHTRRRRAAPKDNKKDAKKDAKIDKEAKKKGGRGDMAAVGTTSNANYDSAVANADAIEGTRNDAKFAETNALVWRGGEEKMQTGFAGIREWHPHGGICLHPPCKKIANSMLVVEDNNIVKGASEEPDIDYYKIAVLPPSRDDIDKPGLLEPVPDIDYYKIAVLPPSKDDEGKLALWENEPDIDYYKIAVLPPSKDDEGKLALWENEPDIDYYKIAVLPPSKDDEGKLALWETEPDIDYYKIAVLPPSKDDEGKLALWENEPDIDYYKIAVYAPDVDDPLPGAVPPPLIQKMGPFPPNPTPYCPLSFDTLLLYKVLMHRLTLETTAKEHGSRWDQQWASWALGTSSSFTGITIAHTRASASDFDPSKYEITKEESEAFSNRDHGAKGQKERDDRFELFDKFSRYDPYTALLVPKEPSRPVYLCPFAPIPEPFLVIGKEEKRIIKGTGHLAATGTTSIGGKNTAAATADAQDSDHNLINSASSNAMVFRGGAESLAYGGSDRQFFNKKPKVCIGPQCLPTKRRIV